LLSGGRVELRPGEGDGTEAVLRLPVPRVPSAGALDLLLGTEAGKVSDVVCRLVDAA
jgi:hypothetical protein